MLIGIVSELSTLVMPPNYRIGIPLVVIAAGPHLPAAGPVRAAATYENEPRRDADDLVPRPAGIVVCFSAILALALNFQWGLGGMVNFGLAGFYTLGAYACALLILKGGANTLVATLGAMAIVAAACAASSRW